jgi:hypothetical protein
MPGNAAAALARDLMLQRGFVEAGQGEPLVDDAFRREELGAVTELF